MNGERKGNLVEKIIPENFPNLENDAHIQVQESQSPNEIYI